MENRKKIDFNLIVGAAKKEPRTFTELLHVTKLSRKTLSLRLKEMCANDILVKGEGKYKLNGDSEFDNNSRNFAKGFSRVFNNRRMRAGLMLIALLLSSSASGYVLAMFFAPKEDYRKPVVIGTFTMALNVTNVKDLYAWQVFITFNSSELKVMEITPGGFVGVSYPFFLNATDIGEDKLLLGGTRYGDVSGRDGNGTLATIVFGYYVDEYEEPIIALSEEGFFNTFLLNSEGFVILVENPVTLTLDTIENA